MSPKDAESLVYAFITSRLDYCNALFSGFPAHSISRLQYIQNSAARMLTYTKRSAHILFNLHWLPVSSCIIYKMILLMFKSLHGLAPTYLSDLHILLVYFDHLEGKFFVFQDLAFHLFCLISNLYFFIINFGTHCPCVSSHKFWNSLPLCLQS